MTCGNTLKHMLSNILIEMIDSPALWKISEDIERDCLTLDSAISLNHFHDQKEKLFCRLI